MLKNFDLIIFFIFFLIFFEFFLILVVKSFKKDFQWIINKDDEFPFKTNAGIKEFISNSYNHNTGWDRKKNTSGYETLNKKKTFYKISKDGFRETFCGGKISLISVFGDSYAFCRYVNNDKTWEAKLENKFKKSVRNYGVGNFGLDQSFIKYQKTKLPKTTKLVIFAFVPETISRINSYWKHYSEFGNKYGFKPIFEFKKKKLILRKNVLNKNITIKKLKQKILSIKSKDIFYERRFSYYMFKFPYLFSYFKSIRRNNIIFLNLFLYKLFDFLNSPKKKIFYLNCYNKIVKDNIIDANKMYAEKKHEIHLSEMMLKINKTLKNKKLNCLFLVLPQMHDIFISRQKKTNYEIFYEKIKKKNNLNIFDLTSIFKKEKKINALYLEDKYGGHLSIKGNSLVANKLFKYINSKNLL